MAEEELAEKYRRLASLIEELSKKYEEVGVSEEFVKRLEDIEKGVDFKLKEMDEKLESVKAIFTKKFKEELLASAKKQIEEGLKEIKELPELRKMAILEGVIEKLSEKVEDFDGRLATLERESKKPIEKTIPEIEEIRDFIASSDKIITSKAREEAEKRLKNIFLGIRGVEKDIKGIVKANKLLSAEIESLEKRVATFNKILEREVKRSVKEEFVKKLRENVKVEVPKVVESYFADIEDKLSALVNKRVSFLKEELKKLSSSFGDIKDEIEEMKKFKEDIGANLLKIREGVSRDVKDELATLLPLRIRDELKGLTVELEKRNKKIGGEIENLKKKFKEMLKINEKNIRKKVKNFFVKESSKLKEDIKKRVDERILKFQDTQSNFLAKFEELGKNLENRIDEVNIAFSSLKNFVEEKLKAKEIEKIVGEVFEKKVKEIEEKIEKNESDISKLSKRVSEIEKSIEALPKLLEEVEK